MPKIGSFDANKVEPSTGRPDPMPAGWYVAMIVESDVKKTKKEDGNFAELVFEVQEGDFARRKIWTRLNLDNPSLKAVQIAEAELSAICHAVDRLMIETTEELHNLPMRIKVKIEAASGGYEASNKITTYKNVSEKEEAAVAAASGTSDTGKTAPPWAQK